MAVDTDRLNAFLGRFVGDLGATVAAGGVVVGHRLGLYRALADGPATPDELADRTGTHARYVAEWLRGQAAGGYVEYDAATGAFSLTEEQAFALTDPDGPLYVPGAFVLALGTLRAESQITDAFRTGAGMGWHEHHDDVFGRLRAVLPPRLPRQPGAELDPGARRGRGEARARARGWPTSAAASALRRCCWRRPTRATLSSGSDYHDGSIELARKRAAEAGVGGAHRLRGRRPRRLPRRRLRPGHHVRLPARHGRPGGRGPARPRGARARTAPG